MTLKIGALANLGTPCKSSPPVIKTNEHAFVKAQDNGCTVCASDLLWRLSCAGVSLEAGYRRSTAAYVASHRRLLNLTFKRVVVVISSTETGRNNYESLYFIL